MRSPALFAMILVGAAATASAVPERDEASGRVSHTDANEPSDTDGAAPRAQTEWVELTTPSPAKHGTVHVIVDKSTGPLARLRVDAARGRVDVKRVRVTFGDGTTQTYRVNKTIHVRRAKSAIVELGAPRVVETIAVTTARNSRGTYRVFGTGAGERVAEH